MNILKKSALVMLGLIVAACGGGGGNAGDPPFGDGTGAGTTVSVSKLSLALDRSQVTNSGTESVVATVTATNSSNQVVKGAAVTLSVDSEATLAVLGQATNDQGELKATVRIGPDRSNRMITVTAQAQGAAPVTATFEVTGSSLVGTPVPALLSSGAAGVIRYRLADATAKPMAGYAITVQGIGSTVTTGVTNANGEFDYSYTAPSTAGDITVTASAAGDQEETVVTVQSAGSGSIPNAQGTVASPSVSANPDVVAVSTDTTAGQAQLRAVFLGDRNEPIKNIRVRFDLNGDVNSVGGQIGTGSNLVYSNADGIALSTYVAGTRSSPTNGVTIRACWDYSDFGVGTCPNQVTTKLTVASEPVSIAIGTDNTIDPDGDGGLSYIKKYVVQVSDSSGVAKSGVQITASIDLVEFMKGTWGAGTPWVKRYAGDDGSTPRPYLPVLGVDLCKNEDTNRNNALDTGEDKDGDGQLEPRKGDVVVSYPSGSITNTDGTVIVQIKYPKNVASWVNFDLKVSAGVSASEGVARWNGGNATLPYAADDVKDVEVPPPFAVSPYGIKAGCSVH